MPSAVSIGALGPQGKLLEQPVYSRPGGPHKDRRLHLRYEQRRRLVQELGFGAFQLAWPQVFGGWDGITDRLCGAGTARRPE